MNKKGIIQDLQRLIIPLVSIAIVLVVGFLIISEVRSQPNITDDSLADNASREVMEALDDIPGWLPIIVITVIGALLIGLVGLFRTTR